MLQFIFDRSCVNRVVLNTNSKFSKYYIPTVKLLTNQNNYYTETLQLPTKELVVETILFTEYCAISHFWSHVSSEQRHMTPTNQMYYYYYYYLHIISVIKSPCFSLHFQFITSNFWLHLAHLNYSCLVH